MYKLIFEKFTNLLIKNDYIIIDIYYTTQNSVRIIRYIKCVFNNVFIVIEIPDRYQMLLPVIKNQEIKYKEISSNIGCKLSKLSKKYVNKSINGAVNEDISYFFENKDGIYINDSYYEIKTEKTLSTENAFNSLEDELNVIKHELEYSENIVNEEQINLEDTESKVILIFEESKENEKEIDIINSDVFISVDVKVFHKNVKDISVKYNNIFKIIDVNKKQIRYDRIEYIKLLLNEKLNNLDKKYKSFIEEEKKIKLNINNLQNIMDNCSKMKDNKKASVLVDKTKNAIKDINSRLELLYKDLNSYIDNVEKCLN